MRFHGIFIVLIASLLTGCATGEADLAASKCDVSWIDASQLSPQRACELRALAKRCATSDRCQIQCEANGALPNIGGGCAHACSGGGGVQTDEDIARNGGTFATEDSLACQNQAR